MAITATVTVKDEDGIPIATATVTILDNAGAVKSTGSTDASGVYADATITTSDPIPPRWRVVAKKTGYYKAGGYMIWPDATSCKQNLVLLDDVG